MKYVYKIYSGYDRFTPRRLPDRLLAEGLLRLRWERYIEAVDVGDEVWVYFFGPGGFVRGVYARARVLRVALDENAVYAQVFESALDAPLTDDDVSGEIAELVRPRGVQVFLFPQTLRVTDTCTVGAAADTCARRYCEDCPVWQGFYRIAPDTVKPPGRLTASLATFAPAYWVLTVRGFMYSEASPDLFETSELFMRYKTGKAELAFPLALGIRAALRAHDAPQFEAIVPVPLSPDKEAAGELNRTLRLAQELGLLMGRPVRRLVTLDGPISKRALGTGAPDFEFRYRTLLRIDPAVANLESVLLVDDVTTHGSTADTIVRALRRVNRGLQVGVASAGQMVVKSAVTDPAPLRR
jgi:hypothetical protein